MSREEFHRRYELMPGVKKAELLKGIVYMGSPVSTLFHGEPDNLMNTWLGVYAASTPGVRASSNATVILDEESEPQPDVCLRIEAGGTSRVDENGFTVGPPELAVETSASTRSYDLHVKLDVYRQSGVQEYLVWRVLDAAIDWFILRDGQYVAQAPDASDLLKSEVFPGLWLDVTAMLRHDMATVLKRLQEGLGTEAHQAFVARQATPKA